MASVVFLGVKKWVLTWTDWITLFSFLLSIIIISITITISCPKGQPNHFRHWWTLSCSVNTSSHQSSFSHPDFLQQWTSSFPSLIQLQTSWYPNHVELHWPYRFWHGATQVNLLTISFALEKNSSCCRLFLVGSPRQIKVTVEWTTLAPHPHPYTFIKARCNYKNFIIEHFILQCLHQPSGRKWWGMWGGAAIGYSS